MADGAGCGHSERFATGFSSAHAIAARFLLRLLLALVRELATRPSHTNATVELPEACWDAKE